METLPTTQYTKQIFRQLYAFVAPVLPTELEEEMRHALEHIEQDADLTREDIEETMIIFGKRVWPYRKALQEAIGLHEGNVGSKFFRSALSRKMQKKFDEFTSHGGTVHDIHSGAPADFFTTEERIELNHALVNMNTQLTQFAVQSVKGTGHKQFQSSVQEFITLLDNLENQLSDIRVMADDAQEHPMIAREMREHIRGFEYGLVLLGKEYTQEAVEKAQEHFHGRRRELKVRGFDIALNN
ncbi:MAG: hypothetical protein UV82_C0003G0078 [Candidatus Magasanikbacteria bacterium GW2011_GWD2_43_18]|uniref:Uncharacterized protein n=1 Tax=Candidatus Magasanikbacteria bacterium GW2011_GWE2_42_7 TaxID=1619052 RepID=A0A0G1BHM6_9BACT|nr:MAG: hypothetical protein UV18_C0006G0061 [Candidatus Magasanikbacteria bacterium GW2011_GWC2_42_27]KKS72689.1 MAG: hypothetical protein UV42_C0005G0006 [Candidatus Magasanikbacteria bacterium GW2011_GWE2_42_7]KKT04978.1 MAG: hypothetical protein UV82_C0003G0078 [Candidatus Magasanikbacteria bacterium GW2011_GWD2_43_18]KKT25100.1 MAG: hypothetical protein UW10_C0014G0011 [Candidatus Magasanikbacteria bacterium GW2011_GWA2_43_9]HBB38289.1 hypothetical protein [Candidatus Magasanikbacteria bac